MVRKSRLAAGAAFIAGLAVAAAALADSPHGPSGGGSHGGAGGIGHASSGGFHGSMPSHGFRSAPPDFHGSLPHGGPSPSHMGQHQALGRPGHDIGTFHGHDFAHFSAGERAAWEGGAWRHTWHNGHYGWWWFVGGDWFFYAAPIYPYPLYVGPDSYYDYYDTYGAPDYYWYYCEDPQGYYPYVRHCAVPWQPVPPQADTP